jgi:hypothetical protein
MTQKVYKTAMGKTVDMGQLMLENEQVRAVGNMNVNARGDLLDSSNRVIDPKPRQVQRQYQKQAARPTPIPVSTGTRAARSQKATTSAVESISFGGETVIDSSIPQEPVPEFVAQAPAVEQQDPAVVQEVAEVAPSVIEPTAPAEPEPMVLEMPAPVAPPSATASAGGLAAALAKSRTVQQEKIKTPRQISQTSAGVKRI